jgi:hypothetical protein
VTRRAALSATALFAALGAAAAQTPATGPTPSSEATVQSLLGSGYAVVSSFPSAIGPGIFLQKAASLYLCFISETPQSADLRTDSCKPVR